MSLRGNLAANLRRIRTERKWSQDVFAGEVDLHRTYINALEGGRRSPTIDVIEKMMRALDVPVTDLLGEPPNTK